AADASALIARRRFLAERSVGPFAFNVWNQTDTRSEARVSARRRQRLALVARRRGCGRGFCLRRRGARPRYRLPHRAELPPFPPFADAVVQVRSPRAAVGLAALTRAAVVDEREPAFDARSQAHAHVGVAIDARLFIAGVRGLELFAVGDALVDLD